MIAGGANASRRKMLSLDNDFVLPPPGVKDGLRPAHEAHPVLPFVIRWVTNIRDARAPEAFVEQVDQVGDRERVQDRLRSGASVRRHGARAPRG